MAGIELVQLRKAYTVDQRRIPILNGLDLSIPEKAITVVLGKSGCGCLTSARRST